MRVIVHIEKYIDKDSNALRDASWYICIFRIHQICIKVYHTKKNEIDIRVSTRKWIKKTSKEKQHSQIYSSKKSKEKNSLAYSNQTHLRTFLKTWHDTTEPYNKL